MIMIDDTFLLFHWLTGWWCNNHLEKYEFVNGKDDIPDMKWKINNVPNHQPENKYNVTIMTTHIIKQLKHEH